MRASRLFLAALPLAAALAILSAPAAAQDHDDDDGADWVARCQRWNRGDDRETFCEVRETRIAAPSVLEVDGRENGGVSVEAWDGRDVLVRQQIQAWAPTRDEARSVAQAVRVSTSGGEIHAEILVFEPEASQCPHFGAVIRGEAQPLVSVRDGLANLRITEAIVDAARSGTVVHIAVN